MPLLRPDRDLDGELVRTCREAFSVSRGHAGVDLDGLSGLRIIALLNIEGPDELGDGVEEITVRHVDSRT